MPPPGSRFCNALGAGRCGARRPRCPPGVEAGLRPGSARTCGRFFCDGTFSGTAYQVWEVVSLPAARRLLPRAAGEFTRLTVNEPGAADGPVRPPL